MSCWRWCRGIPKGDWFQPNARAFLEVRDLFGRQPRSITTRWWKRFIHEPADELETRLWRHHGQWAAAVSVVRALEEMLRDLRTAADRQDIPTRHADLARLRALLS